MKFKVISNYVGEEGHEVEAKDAVQAASFYAQWEDFNTADFSFAKGSEETITVESPDGTQTKFRIECELSPTYSAHEVKP